MIIPTIESLLIDNELSSKLNKRIQQLDINIRSELNQLMEINSAHFPNVQYVHFCLNRIREAQAPNCYAHYLITILTKFTHISFEFFKITDSSELVLV